MWTLCVGRIRGKCTERICFEILAIAQDLLDLRAVFLVEVVELGCSYCEIDRITCFSFY